MTENPLVTIVIPTWNRKALLREATASVAAQTYRNWELVVADDGSSDGTVEELRKSADPRIRVVALEHSGNISHIRNAAASAGSGALIAFLDSDDLWLPRKLELQVAALRGGPARWCYAGYAHVDVQGTPIAPRAYAFQPENGRILRSLLTERTSCCICTLLVERTLFDVLGGFDEDLAVSGDRDFELRLAAAAEAVAVAEVVTLVRDHSGRSTAMLENPHELSAMVFAKFLARERDPELLGIARAHHARLLADAGLRRIARGDIARGSWLLAAGVVGGASLLDIGRRIAAGAGKRLGLRRSPHKGAETPRL